VSAEEATGQLEPDENEAKLQALTAALKDAEARAKASEAKAKELQTKLTEYVRHLYALNVFLSFVQHLSTAVESLPW
jgi:multidrug resistance efflux pump